MLCCQEAHIPGRLLLGIIGSFFFPYSPLRLAACGAHMWLLQNVVPGNFRAPERSRVTEITRQGYVPMLTHHMSRERTFFGGSIFTVRAVKPEGV